LIASIFSFLIGLSTTKKSKSSCSSWLVELRYGQPPRFDSLLERIMEFIFFKKNLAGETGIRSFFLAGRRFLVLKIFFLMKTVEVILPPPT
jgi:hypothetical protein